jgi:zinc transport system substrate-binding protein
MSKTRNVGLEIVLRVIYLVLLAATILPAAAGRPISVFVSILPQKYFVERVGGKRIKVNVMVLPGHSPATYEPTPRQLLRLSDARAYFRIGVPFEESWIERIRAANPRMNIIDTSGGIGLLHPQRSGLALDASHLGHDKDPHSWTSPPVVGIQSQQIRDALVELDPANKREYEANHRRFAQALKELDQYIRNRLRDIDRRSFLVFHPSWGYYAQTYGLRQISIEKQGKVPGAKQLTEIIDLARSEGIKVIFIQRQFSRETAESIARAIGAKMITVDPLAENYIDNLKHVTDTFAQAMCSQ